MVTKLSQGQTSSRSRLKTLETLEKVIEGLVTGSEKMSIASVARAAGVTPGLIHNTYPAVAEKIRTLTGRSVRAQRDSKQQALIAEKEKNKVLRAENGKLLEELARIASINQRLIFEVAELRAVASGKVVALPNKVSR